MQRKNLLAAVTVVIGVSPGLVGAGPLEPARLPADTTWVMHADLEHAAATRLGGWGLAEIHKDLSDEPVFTELDISLGEDLKDLTLFGWDDEDEGEVVVVSMTEAADRVIEYIMQHEKYELLEHEIGRVHSWTEDGEAQSVRVFAVSLAVEGDRLIYAGENLGAVIRAVRVLKGEEESRAGAGSGRLPVKTAEGAFVFFAATETRALRKHEAAAQITKLADVVSFSMGEQGEDGFANLSVSARTEEEARNITGILGGLKALALMWIAQEDEELAWLRDLANSIEFSPEGLNVTATCRFNVEEIIKAIEEQEREESGDGGEEADGEKENATG